MRYMGSYGACNVSNVEMPSQLAFVTEAVSLEEEVNAESIKVRAKRSKN